LPHRFPFLLIDRITEVIPGVSACAIKQVSNAVEAFPQIMLIECIAQLAGIAANHEQGEGGFLATIDNAVFDGQILPGDSLEIRTEVIKSFGRLCLIKGEVRCNSIKLVDATMTLGIGTI